MKNYSIFLLVFIFGAATAFSSCSKKCAGGGWYGDRNLGYTPMKKRPADTVSPIICEAEEIDCNISNP